VKVLATSRNASDLGGLLVTVLVGFIVLSVESGLAAILVLHYYPHAVEWWAPLFGFAALGALSVLAARRWL
jgi:hypothetical protein